MIAQQSEYSHKKKLKLRQLVLQPQLGVQISISVQGIDADQHPLLSCMPSSLRRILSWSLKGQQRWEDSDAVPKIMLLLRTGGGFQHTSICASLRGLQGIPQMSLQGSPRLRNVKNSEKKTTLFHEILHYSGLQGSVRTCMWLSASLPQRLA